MIKKYAGSSVTLVMLFSWTSCFKTDSQSWGVFTHSLFNAQVWFVWAYVNTPFALDTEQNKSAEIESVVTVYLHLNPGTVCLQSKLNQPFHLKQLAHPTIHVACASNEEETEEKRKCFLGRIFLVMPVTNEITVCLRMACLQLLDRSWMLPCEHKGIKVQMQQLYQIVPEYEQSNQTTGRKTPLVPPLSQTVTFPG